MMGGLVHLLLCCGLVLAGRPASATKATEEKQSALGVLETTHKSELDPVARKELETYLRTGLARGEAPLLDRRGDPDCDATCREGFQEAGASHVVRASVEQQSRDYQVKLELIDVKTGEVVGETEATCEICGLDELGELLEGQGALVQTKLRSLDVRAPVLVVTSTPSGAAVQVDGELVGRTPLEREVLPGEHTVRIRRVGYVSEDRRVTMVDGVTQKVTADLKRKPGQRRAIIFGAVSTGVGTALLATGIGLLAVNGREQPGCAPENIDAQGTCKYIFKTVPGGATLAISGAVMATVGVMLLIQNRDLLAGRRTKKHARARRLQPGISPFGVSLRGSF